MCVFKKIAGIRWRAECTSPAGRTCGIEKLRAGFGATLETDSLWRQTDSQHGAKVQYRAKNRLIIADFAWWTVRGDRGCYWGTERVGGYLLCVQEATLAHLESSMFTLCKTERHWWTTPKSTTITTVGVKTLITRPNSSRLKRLTPLALSF